MPLTCGCDYDDGGADEFYNLARDYTTLKSKRRKRCSSCHELIELGAICAEHPRWRLPNSDTEERIWGECGEVYQASYWHCERCADLCFSLEELGFCVFPGESMLELVREYRILQEEERLRKQLKREKS